MINLSMIRNFFRGFFEPNLSMYPIKGSCRFQNIMEQLVTGSVQSVTVPTDGDFPQVWTIGIDLENIDGAMHLIPFISYVSEYFPRCRLGYHIGIKNLGYCTSTVVLPSQEYAYGFELKFLELKPEILVDGALVIEYGIRVEALQDRENIWNFQLSSDSFDSKGKQVMVPIRENERTWRCHPQIKAIHHDKSIEFKEVYIDFHVILQIAHGVRYQYSGLYWINEMYWTAHYAHLMGLRNVIHYCEWQLIRKPFPDTTYLESKEIIYAVEYNMRICLAHFIRELNSKDKLMKVLKRVIRNKMSGESMKTFMKFLLYD